MVRLNAEPEVEVNVKEMVEFKLETSLQGRPYVPDSAE
jgi:hypothetical protein